jgi:hypothetical protein
MQFVETTNKQAYKMKSENNGNLSGIVLGTGLASPKNKIAGDLTPYSN